MDHTTLRSRQVFQMDRRDSDSFIDLDKLWSMVVRRFALIAMCVAGAIVLAGVYLLMVQPSYTAMTQILVDEDMSRFAEDEPGRQSGQQLDNSMSSSVEILKSKALAMRVVDDGKFAENDILMNPPKSPVDALKGTVRSMISALLPSKPPASEGAMEAGLREKAAAILRQSLSVERVGRSSVIALSVRSPEPVLSARIAKAYAKAYLEEQLSANFEATERASSWLQERLTDLNTRSQQASMAVEQYKNEHGLVSPRGELMTTQQLSDLNSQLIAAQADTATAEARYRQYEAILEQGQAAAVTNAVISSLQTDNSILQDLRKRYIAVNDREQEVTKQFGADHPQALALKADRQDISRQIFNELQQLTESFRNEFEVAKSREASLRDNIAQVTGKNSDANVSMVQLAELEQKASALKTLYQSYLTRFEQTAQQQSFPIAKARVISEAGVPSAPSSPKKTLTMALSVVLGGLVGCGLAGFLELKDRTFRTGQDVRDRLGVRFLGYLPWIDMAQHSRKSADPSHDPGVDAEHHAVPDHFRQMMRLAVDAPRSPYTEVLRHARIATELALKGRKCRVIGIVSCLPGEGSTTVAANFAGLMAMSGQRTLVIDGNLREPSLSKMLAKEPEAGLLETLYEGIEWTKVVRVDRRSKLAIMPIASLGSSFAHSSEVFTSAGMGQLLGNLRDMFDVIVIDLPPLVPVIDAKALEPQLDGFIFVTQWGKTPVKVVENLLAAEPQIAAKTIGMMLNKTDMERLHRYADPGAAERFREQFTSYYDGGGYGQQKPLLAKPDRKAPAEESEIETS